MGDHLSTEPTIGNGYFGDGAQKRQLVDIFFGLINVDKDDDNDNDGDNDANRCAKRESSLKSPSSVSAPGSPQL